MSDARDATPLHVPVMADEALRLLDPKPGETIVDGTLGTGGHSKLILHALDGAGILLGLDRDPNMVEIARRELGTSSHAAEPQRGAEAMPISECRMPNAMTNEKMKNEPNSTGAPVARQIGVGRGRPTYTSHVGQALQHAAFGIATGQECPTYRTASGEGARPTLCRKHKSRLLCRARKV